VKGLLFMRSKTSQSSKKNKTPGGIPLFLKMTFANYVKEWKLSLVVLLLIFLIVGFQIMIPLLTSQMTMDIMQKHGGAKPNKYYWGAS